MGKLIPARYRMSRGKTVAHSLLNCSHDHWHRYNVMALKITAVEEEEEEEEEIK